MEETPTRRTFASHESNALARSAVSLATLAESPNRRQSSSERQVGRSGLSRTHFPWTARRVAIALAESGMEGKRIASASMAPFVPGLQASNVASRLRVRGAV